MKVEMPEFSRDPEFPSEFMFSLVFPEVYFDDSISMLNIKPHGSGDDFYIVNKISFIIDKFGTGTINYSTGNAAPSFFVGKDELEIVERLAVATHKSFENCVVFHGQDNTEELPRFLKTYFYKYMEKYPEDMDKRIKRLNAAFEYSKKYKENTEVYPDARDFLNIIDERNRFFIVLIGSRESDGSSSSHILNDNNIGCLARVDGVGGSFKVRYLSYRFLKLHKDCEDLNLLAGVLLQYADMPVVLADHTDDVSVKEVYGAFRIKYPECIIANL